MTVNARLHVHPGSPNVERPILTFEPVLGQFADVLRVNGSREPGDVWPVQYIDIFLHYDEASNAQDDAIIESLRTLIESAVLLQSRARERIAARGGRATEPIATGS